LPLAHVVAGLPDGLADQGVSHNIPNDLQGRQKGYPALEKRSQRPAEPRHGHLAVHGPDDGKPQQDAVPHVPAPFGLRQKIVERDGPCRQPRDDHPPERLQEAAHTDEEDRDERQGLVHLVEDPRHVGHHEGDQEEQDHAADEEHEERVGEGGPDAPFQGLLLFAEVRKPLEHEVERARGLPRPDHVQVERRKDLRVMGHGLGKAAPLVDLFLDLGQDLLELRVGGLRDQGRQ